MEKLKFAMIVGAIGLLLGSCSKSEVDPLGPNQSNRIAETEEELLAAVSDQLASVGLDVNNLQNRSDVFYYAVPGRIDPNCVENNYVHPSCCFDGSICYVVIQEKRDRSAEEDLGLIIPNDGSENVYVGTLNIDQDNPTAHEFTIENDL
jgi:hypothetical protein